MAATSRDEATKTKRLNRLAGSGRGSGGGLPLPDLFSAMLNEVLDNAPVSTGRMAEITSSVLGFKQQAVFATWGTWEALAADALAQMESRKVIQREDGSWVQGPKLVTGQRIEIIPARPDVGSKSDGVTVWTRQDRRARSSADHANRTFLEYDAETARRGHRRVTRERRELILESMRQLGDLREYFPVLVDSEGNVVDGHHRREIDPAWPADEYRIVPTDKRLAVSLAANQTNGWTKDDWKRLREKREAVESKTDVTRTLIRLALQEDASRASRVIAELVGCSPSTVTDEREALVQLGQVHRHEFTTAKTGKHSAACWCGQGDAAPRQPRPPSEAEVKVEELLLDNPEQSNKQIMAAVGLSDNQHRVVERVRDRLEEAGSIPPALTRQGSDGRVRHVPNAPAPPVAPRPQPAVSPQSAVPPQPQAADNAAVNAWSKIIGRMDRITARWRSAPPDRDSALKELEALRREIDEEIEALRR